MISLEELIGLEIAVYRAQILDWKWTENEQCKQGLILLCQAQQRDMGIKACSDVSVFTDDVM